MGRPEPISISCDDCPGGTDCDDCLVGFVLAAAEARARVHTLVTEDHGGVRRDVRRGPAGQGRVPAPGSLSCDLEQAFDALRRAGLDPVLLAGTAVAEAAPAADGTASDGPLAAGGPPARQDAAA